MNGTYSIVHATDMGNLKVHLVFSDGIERTVDVGAFLRKHPHAQHNKYLDPREFAKFKLVDGNIVWGRDGDLMFELDGLHDGQDLNDGDTRVSDELMTQLYGPVGTPERDRIDAAAHTQRTANEIGQKVVLLRVEHGLTRKELAAKAMVDERTVAKVENGHDASLFDIGKIFLALGIRATYDMGRLGRVALW